jgi:hypothetical protein
MVSQFNLVQQTRIRRTLSSCCLKEGAAGRVGFPATPCEFPRQGFPVAPAVERVTRRSAAVVVDDPTSDLIVESLGILWSGCRS